jgi:uncharacterized protein YndB with AHSA1/START domain
MNSQNEALSGADTVTKRVSDRELVVTRSFKGPARLIYKAWTTPELMMRWWSPPSFGITLISCEMDVRTGGSYRLSFGVPGSDQPVDFHGRYIEAEPPHRLVWTNEEGEEGAVTTLTFEERDGRTYLHLSDLYPSKEALDEAIASGSTSGYPEQFNSLDALIEQLPA